MTILLINSSAPQALLVLIQDGNVLAQESWLSDKTLGTKLLSAIDAVLKNNNLTLDDVDRVAVHGGPGHYSALRTGITMATFLALGKNSELVQVEGERMEDLVEQAIHNKPVKVISPKYET